MKTITTRNDIAVYVDNNHADFAQTMGDEGRAALIDAIQAADHPAYGTDWAEWLDANVGAIRVEAELAADEAADTDDAFEAAASPDDFPSPLQSSRFSLEYTLLPPRSALEPVPLKLTL